MVRKKRISRTCMIIAISLLASSAPALPTGSVAFADKQEQTEAVKTVTGVEFLAKAVDVYLRMGGADVTIPEDWPAEYGEGVLKAAALGYVNLEEIEAYRGIITKQDAFAVLYRMILSYDSTYEMGNGEAEAILNECYDNAYIKPENRVSYAFMLKHGMIDTPYLTEPDKDLTLDDCNGIIKRIFQLFNKNIYISMADTILAVNDSLPSLLQKLGEPNRIDETEYGFQWYVYNTTYTSFIMVGVQRDKVCAFYTNAKDFDFGEVTAGSHIDAAAEYWNVDGLHFYTDEQGIVDSILYNPIPAEGSVLEAKILEGKMNQLLDLMNAYRTKNGKMVFVDKEAAKADSGEPFDAEGIVTQQSGEHIQDIYNQIVNSVEGKTLLSVDNRYPTLVSVNMAVDETGTVVSAVSTQNEISPVVPSREEKVVLAPKDYSVQKPETVATPEILSPVQDQVIEAGSDVTVQLKEAASNHYLVKIFDLEADDYLVNSYMTTGEATITFPAEIFQEGADYRVCVTALDEGQELPGNVVTFAYGQPLAENLVIQTPYNKGVTYDDEIAVSLESPLYHDYRIDLYDGENEPVFSQLYRNTSEIILTDAAPGQYSMCVTALSRGSERQKLQNWVTFTIKAPEVFVTETILEPGETYYFEYGDENSPYVYFYDEVLIDEKNDQGEDIVKKKIIQRKVTATRKNREQAGLIPQKEYTTAVMTSVGASGTGSAIANMALQYQGVPYLWGGTSPSGFDCSGLVQYVCNKLGVKVHRTSREQFAQDGVSVDKSDLQAGDLVFFQKNGQIHHVGIYIGNDYMVHAPRTGDVVKISSLNSSYYQEEYAGAKRLY